VAVNIDSYIIFKRNVFREGDVARQFDESPIDLIFQFGKVGLMIRLPAGAATFLKV
jgi:hypothetical protein